MGFDTQVRSYDAIVVGAGAAGGLASLLLTESNLRVLCLDAGWRPPLWSAPYRHAVAALTPKLADIGQTANLHPQISLIGQRALKAFGRVRQPVQSKFFAWMFAPDAFVDDRDFPYSVAPGSRFEWFRTHQTGGRMFVPGHGRQYYRLDDDAFAAHWPFDAKELGPWYEAVEERLKLSGDNHAPTEAEQETLARLGALWPDANPVLGNSAPPLDSIALAQATGLLDHRGGASVSNVDIDASGRVQGVQWTDRATGDRQSAKAPIVFLCASALESTRILLSSSAPTTGAAPGAPSGALGRYLMDHITVSAGGEGPPLPTEEPANPGRCVFLSRTDEDEIAGRSRYGIQVYRWSIGARSSRFTGVSFAEMAPRPENHVTLDTNRRDICGNPTLRITCAHSSEDIAVATMQSAALRETAEALDVVLDRIDTAPAPAGTAMHECGTARMGDDPASSVLDPNNQCWDAKGLFVTDGAALPSQGTQHPTLTIMALTARACKFAARNLQWAAAALLEIDLANFFLA